VESLFARLPRNVRPLLTVLGVLVIAEIDYASGVELRTYPLYYLPIAFAAWYVGRTWTVIAALLSTLGWLSSNYLAGLRYSTGGVWVFNFTMQSIAHLVVGLLIAQLRHSLARERELSRLDPLTSLLNPRAFHEEGRRVLSECRRRKRPLTLAYIDLDDFQAVNDQLGHHAGDAMLQRVAEGVRACTRISDLAARIGGDEFVILYPETGAGQARGALDRLRHALAESLSTTEQAVTASIGAVAFEAPPESVEEMVRVADERMYAAKAAGKDRIQLDVVGAPEPVSAPSG
jgi:diguanylate cyclase (GGDEF)-like protein